MIFGAEYGGGGGGGGASGCGEFKYFFGEWILVFLSLTKES